MKIVFALSATYNNNVKFYKRQMEFGIRADTISFLPSLTSFQTNDATQIRSFHEDYLMVYHELCDNWNSWNDTKYELTSQDSLFDDIFSRCKFIFDKISKLDLKNDFFKNQVYKIPIHLCGNPLAWKTFLSVSKDKIFAIDPKDLKPGDRIIHKIPFLEEKINKLSNGKHTCSFIFEGILSSSGGFTSGKIFDFDKYIKLFNCSNEIISKIVEKIKCKHEVNINNIVKFSFLQNWLVNIHKNVQNFITISDILKEKICTKSKELFYQINSLSFIWNSLMYEIIKPYKIKTDTLPLMLSKISDNVDISNEIKGFNLLNFIKQEKFKIVDGKKVSDGFINSLSNTDMNTFIKILSKCRLSTFHLSEHKPEVETFEEENNICYMTADLWWEHNDQWDKVMSFLESAKSLVVNAFYLIWQVYNWKCGEEILGPAEMIKQRYLNIKK